MNQGHEQRLGWKVCCIASVEEARSALRAGADVLGLVAEMPSGPGVLADEEIARIAEAMRAESVETWLLTSRTGADAIAEHIRSVATTGVQIVGAQTPGTHERLRQLVPESLRIVQVVHVEGEEAIAEAFALAPMVDALLLDSGRPSQGTLGGTGEVHDWTISRRLIREVRALRSDLPVWVAGGLNARNMAAAVRAVDPNGLDLCSGLRTEGRLDEVKLAKFREGVAALRSNA